MSNIFNFSLRSKIISMSLFLCALMGLGGYLSLQKMSKSYNNTFYSNQAERAVVLSNKITAQFYERYGDIQAFALNPVVRELNAKKLPEYLDAYTKLYGIYEIILVVDAEGNYVGSNTKDTSDKSLNITNLKAKNFKDEPWFKAAFEKKWTADKSKNFDGTFFEDVHIDPMYDISVGEKRTGTSFTSAITDEKGHFVGVITNRANNRWFETEMISMYSKMKEDGFPDAEVTLLNKEGFIISNLAPKTKNDKMEFDTDTDTVLFKENFFKLHMPAGEKMAKHENGSMRSIHGGVDEDLIGYKFVNDEKFIADIGWTVALHLDAETAFAAENAALMNFYFLTGIFTFICLSIAVWFGFSVSKSVSSIISVLANNSSEVSDASTKIASQSTELSESATEQAAALQETVAAVDEINAMVEKNAEAAEKSKEMSSNSRETASKGKQIVENMLLAVNDINVQNDEISNQMQQTNSQLTEITKLINDIGSKTKVINEIVFQTKLLSFNASVEAARAGEYGKGFAVVAEEVGNLAQMSGNAAKEITEMLEQSVRQVETIIGETKTRVERLMSESHKKVDVGIQTAKECSEALEEILGQVSSVDALVSEIAVASQEQSTGIREISKAVGQMEEVTQQNSSVAQASSISGEQLRAQATQLDSLVKDLVSIIHGDKNHVEHHPAPVVAKKKPSLVVVNGGKPQTKSSNNFSDPADDNARIKKASGSDFVPSANDPGFED